MSSIIDALKKTQSAIEKRPYTDRSIYGDIEIPHRATQHANAHASLLGQKKTPRFSTRVFKNKAKNTFSFLKRRHVIGFTTVFFLCAGIWLGYRYDNQITNEVSQLANKIATIHINNLTPTPTPAPIAKQPPLKLTLNGTVRAGSKHDAMINNELYRVGDMVGDYRILEIHYDEVTLFNPETKKKITLTTNLS